MELTKIKEYLGQDWQAVENLMKESLSSDNPYINAIYGYMLSNSGKGMRPLLCLLSARLCLRQIKSAFTSCSASSAIGASVVSETGAMDLAGLELMPKAVHACAAAVEILHNGTLMHDDVADGSTLRRGKRTVNSLFGNAASVLSGDYWFSKSFLLVYHNCGPKILELFADAIIQLSTGELIQLDKASKLDTTFQDYRRIIEGKTASLFSTAIVGGALCALHPYKNSKTSENGGISCSRADEHKVNALRKYALNLGLAFQMRDDIFDYTPSIDSGKPAGQDLLEHKITLPLICAMRNGGKGILSAVEKIAPSNPENEKYIAEVLDFVKRWSGVSLAQMVLDEYIENGISALGEFTDCPEKQILIDFARFVGQRRV